MNTSGDPCEDFFDFACGGFLQRKEIPADEGSVTNSFYPVKQELLKRGRALLEQDIDEEKVQEMDPRMPLYNVSE